MLPLGVSAGVIGERLLFVPSEVVIEGVLADPEVSAMRLLL